MQQPSEPESFGRGRAGRRLRVVATARLEPNEQLIRWTRAWVSIDGKLNVLLGARTRDFVVLTDRRLMLWSTGFFTRRPRRRVLADRLDEITVTRVPPDGGRRLVVSSRGHRRLRLELSAASESDRLAGDLTRRTRQADAPERDATQPVPEQMPEQDSTPEPTPDPDPEAESQVDAEGEPE